MTKKYDDLHKDKDFELPQELLENIFREMPPSDAAEVTTPCVVGLSMVIKGIFLSSITINLMSLDYILPTIGFIMIFLGLRNLHRENRWFRVAYISSILYLAVWIPYLYVNATVYGEYLEGNIESLYFSVIDVIRIIMLFAFWQAVKQVQDKAGIKEKSYGAGALFFWYSLMLILGFFEVTASLVVGVILVLVPFIMIIISLAKLEKSMELSGYVVEASPVRIGDDSLAKILVGIILVGIAIGMLFFSKYDMKWSAADLDETVANQTYEHLLELGYPEEQLKDLSTQDLERLQNADYLVKDKETIEITPSDDNLWADLFEKPITKISVTHVAVHMKKGESEGNVWRIIHHFAYNDDAKCKGTAYLELDTSEWIKPEDLSGRLLCEEKGETLTANYHFLGSASYTSLDDFEEEEIVKKVSSGDFSMPASASNRRGYITYMTEITDEDSLLYSASLVNFTEQVGYLQYPVRTAKTWVQEGLENLFHPYYPFVNVESQISFALPDED